MMRQLNIIAAVCNNYGIGFRGDLPWKLKSELKYFNKITRRVDDTTKSNAIIMGRKTFYSIPKVRRPLKDRLNIVLSRGGGGYCEEKNVLIFNSFEGALNKINKEKIENVWIIGGASIYNEAIKSNLIHRIYLTKIFHDFECDTFFPANFENKFREIENSGEIQIENDIRFEYKIYENKTHV